MKLLSLHIDKYKNLTGNYDFTTQDGYIALIGENGSGKSNLLEAISLIFQGLYNKKGIPFNYTIKYQIGDSIYERGKKVAKKDGEKIKASEMTYPSSLIACYSGEDRRLWELAYKDYYYHYFNKAIDKNYIIPDLLYIDKSCWEIALISLICEYDKPDINTFLNSLGITDIIDINISFTIDEDKLNVFKQHDALSWFNSVIQDNKNVNAKTLATTEPNPTSAIAKRERKSKLIFQYLYLLSQPEHNEINKVQKLIREIDIKLKDISFKDLSEGEKKLILIECITKILGDKDSLLLLDEPDAHTHVARKKDLLSAIERFEGQTILTTHSPIFVNQIYSHHKDCLFHIESGEIISSQYINALKKLSDGEIDYIEGTILLSSKRLLITEGPYDKRYLEKALGIFCNKNKKYEVLRQVAIIPSNSAGNADTFYEQVLMPQIEKYDKIVFIFDFDKGGYSGWKKISKKREPKLEALFYQENYNINIDTGNEPEDSNSILVEDFFAPKSYKNQIDEVHFERKTTHKDFRTFKKNMSSIIKTYIEKNYNNFAEDDYDGFKPILDKLIDIFRL